MRCWGKDSAAKQSKEVKRVEEYANLRSIAARLRRHIISMVAAANSGHPGGSLSAVEILTALYFKLMKLDVSQPRWNQRDIFVLSKGHASPVYYAALAERGFFPPEELLSFRKINSRLQGHPDRENIPGVDMTTGSLGQGLSAANGMALAAKLDGQEQRWVYVLLGDGELQEGQVWEAVMTAAHYHLDNCIAFVDWNGLQIDGEVSQVMNTSPLKEKFAAFNWHIQEIDGHDFAQIIAAVETAKAAKGRPSAIIARTIKGKGVSFMENQAGWHGRAPGQEQAQQALKELEVE
ncbi:MAG: transketolase [Eubacteriales bacterium]|nr:transketolase [Eubacteriales bacterium]MDD3073149.1 transketolase [Eubacteriales bacterium]MDD4078771.1 transketolase [Eubacteriales bacterium]MDD4769011.1 transketolase [Eubacteriales bacterium]